MNERRKWLAGPLALAAALWLAGGLLAGADKEEGPDRDFVLRVASKGLAEVQLAQTALDQAKTPEVKKYAARMFQDHKALNKGLADAVGKRPVPLPKKLDKKMQIALDHLLQIKGLDF